MPCLASIGTYLQCWGAPQRRVADDDHDAITLAAEADRAPLKFGGATARVVLVSRNLPLLESSNSAVLLATKISQSTNGSARINFWRPTSPPSAGASPVNPRSGLRAMGHPPRATGVARCVELFDRLREEAVNQVDGVRIGVAHNMSGPTEVAAGPILEGVAHGAR